MGDTVDHQGQRTPLGVISFGFTVGVTAAIGIFALGIAASLFEWGVALAGVLSSLYVGYGPTFVGAVWAFVHGLVFGIFIA
jgi:hypothetical protein